MSWIMPKDSGETLKIFLQRPLWNLALKSEFGTWKLPKKLLAIQRQRIHKIVFCKFLPGVNPIPPPQTYTHSLMDFTAKIFVCNFELKKHRLSLKNELQTHVILRGRAAFFRAGQRLQKNGYSNVPLVHSWLKFNGNYHIYCVQFFNFVVLQSSSEGPVDAITEKHPWPTYWQLEIKRC